MVLHWAYDELDDYLQLKELLVHQGTPGHPLAAAPKLSLAQYEHNEMSAATADPEAWAAAHRAEIQQALKRPGVRFLLRHHPEARRQLADDDCDTLCAFVAGEQPVDMSDEQKAKWHQRIQRILPVLKVIAGIVPPPYNFAVMALSIVLVLIDTNRLTPKAAALLMRAA